MMKKGLLAGLLLPFLMLLTGCGISTEDLAEEVKKNMEEKFKQESISVKIEKLVLVHENGNKYNGLVTVSHQGETENLTVEVIYDGENFKWEIKE